MDSNAHPSLIGLTPDMIMAPGEELDEVTDDIDIPNLLEIDQLTENVTSINGNLANSNNTATTSVLADDPDNIEYLQFLESLMTPNDLPVTSNSQQLLDDADEDCEFTADAQVLNDQSEEFRRDRNAIISKREYQDLVMDVGSDDEDVTATGRVTLEACYARADNYLFTIDQLQLLRRQQENNLQLLMQSYTVERQMRGENNNEMLDHWRHQLMTLVRLKEQATTSTTLVTTTTTPAAENKERTVAFPSLHDTIGLDIVTEWITAPLPQGPDDMQFVRDMGKPVRRRRRIPVGKDGDKAQFFWEAHENKPLCLPKSLQELNRAFSTIFDKALVPQIICANTRARTSFFPAQDALLLIGLHAYGDDWHSIRSHLLPNMTAKQLATRFSNLKSRRYPSNPVKDWHLMRVKALSLEEEEKLRKGVAHFGRKFKLLNARVLRNRPPVMLRQAWREMYPQHPFRKQQPLAITNHSNHSNIVELPSKTTPPPNTETVPRE
ncbi:hypothetical protein BDF19DRAFT_47551 [Syncephalis fuscata]|nr:hypothetical protein BDF19DRAFT_47551 [Syncephalis fuscata]